MRGDAQELESIERPVACIATSAMFWWAALLLLSNPAVVYYVLVPAAPVLLSVAAVTSILAGVLAGLWLISRIAGSYWWAAALLLSNPAVVYVLAGPAAPVLLIFGATFCSLVGLLVVYSIVIFFALLCAAPQYTALVKLCDGAVPFVMCHPWRAAPYYAGVVLRGLFADVVCLWRIARVDTAFKALLFYRLVLFGWDPCSNLYGGVASFVVFASIVGRTRR